jgi:hypothetical protein
MEQCFTFENITKTKFSRMRYVDFLNTSVSSI